MQQEKVIFGAVVALLCAATVSSSALALRFHTRLKALETRSESPDPTASRAAPAAEEAPAIVPTGAAKAPLGAEEPATNAVPAPVRHTMRVTGFRYKGEDTFYVRLSERPDMEVVRSYVTVGPLAQGVASFRYNTHFNMSTGEFEPELAVSGDFAHRTNVTLRIRKGFPLYGLNASSNVVGEALAEDYVHVFRRKDLEPKVDFADPGRYLPPLGARAVALASVNVAKIAADIRAVPSANVVTMLALEEDAYAKIHRNWTSEDDGFVTDLARAAVLKRDFSLSAAPNEKARLALPIVPPEGASSNGIFLVSIANADKGRENVKDEVCWWRDDKARWLHRVVCVTDLGLSCRRTAKGLFVWVTSLTKGTPVENVRVEVYSAANALVAKGRTDRNGWCACATTGAEKPFAVVVSRSDGGDRSFLALRPSMNVEEAGFGEGDRSAYLAPEACAAFAWTERGIYRHGEKMFFHALLRNGAGVAPPPFPVSLELLKPSDDLYLSKTLVPDRQGAVSDDTFAVPDDLPSGAWTFRLKTPGEKGAVLGERKVRIEEFAPPQIRVKVSGASGVAPADFAFTVSAEHLYGGAAKELRCAGAVVFEDVPFAPAAWKGYTFGSADRHLKPSFRELPAARLDATGRHTFSAPLRADTGKPAALVRVTAQGTVFEAGGRPAHQRATAYLHYYPYYIGSTLGDCVRLGAAGRTEIPVACVGPEGRRVAEPKHLLARLERIDNVYSYRRNDAGWATWDSTEVRTVVADELPLVTVPGADTPFALPTATEGDYVLTLTDRAADVVYSRRFYLSDWGDETVRAPLARPTAVAIAADKSFYRPGDVPHLVVKAPFAGTALVSVYREDFLYAKVLSLTNATSEVELLPVEASEAPGLDVKISVVQRVAENARHLAVRAHGEKALSVRRAEDELKVKVAARVDLADPASRRVVAEISARGVADGLAPADAVAVVTLVDEGINLLTEEPTPDPIAFFARPRGVETPLYDLYHRLLPVLGDDVLKANGIHTGGGFGAEMLSRVSPTPTRRFKPLARWQKAVPLVNDLATVAFDLPEFVGEVRVTAVVYDARATGAASVRAKVCPKLVMEGDAPRFAAPGDTFEVSLPLANRSGEAGEVAWRISATSALDPAVTNAVAAGRSRLAVGDSTVIRARCTAPAEPGELLLSYTAEGLGETHKETIELPLRPAVPWRETAGVEALAPGATYEKAQDAHFRYTIVDTPLAELKGAFEFLAEYPYGCLEQTTSRIFPLLSAGDFLSRVSSVAAESRADCVEAGVKRVVSMLRERDFVMWPDCDYAPWDHEVSLYAAHFLVEAEREGARLPAAAKAKVMRFLARWALSEDNDISAYACHTLALAGRPDRDRMLRLYDSRAALSLLARARLARAFVQVGDRPRALQLLANATAPATVREAAFLTLALLALDSADERLPSLVTYLLTQRDKTRCSWGTTAENAHALLALGAYYRAFPPETGRRFVCWRKLDLVPLGEATNETSQITLTRTYRTSEGKVADLAKLSRGDLLIVELKLASAVARPYADLVIEDLLPGAFEPVLGGVDVSSLPWVTQDEKRATWVMRADARDDRMLVFSKRFYLGKNEEVTYRYPVRVVSTGVYALPGAAVEAMYQPDVRSRLGVGRLVVDD